MSKFKIGDRVRCYSDEILVGMVVSVGKWLGVREEGKDYNNTYYYHPKQCRRLKPRKPRRRVFVTEPHLKDLDRGISSVLGYVSNRKIVSDDVEFIEVRRKKGK